VFSGFYAAARLPLQLAATLIKRLVQIIFSIFIVILHPGFKWLLALLTRSRIVRDYVRPVLQQLGSCLYEPYFAFLRSLPPYFATVSIALPLAVLEPAKLYATILIAEKPKVGILLWLFLQGLSFVLIDKTWAAVRPQSRKIWIVGRLHAWGAQPVLWQILDHQLRLLPRDHALAEMGSKYRRGLLAAIRGIAPPEADAARGSINRSV